MNMSPREAGLALATGAVALFSVSFLLARPAVQRWKELRIEQGRVKQEIRASIQLEADREPCASRLRELSEAIPQHPADKKMDVHWLTVMDFAATKNKLKINKRQVGQEKKVGSVYELSIECQDWEGTPQDLLHFLYDLQFEAAMLDIRQLTVTAKPGGGVRGRFSLYCAYVKQGKPEAVDNGRRKQP